MAERNEENEGKRCVAGSEVRGSGALSERGLLLCGAGRCKQRPLLSARRNVEWMTGYQLSLTVSTGLNTAQPFQPFQDLKQKGVRLRRPPWRLFLTGFARQ